MNTFLYHAVGGGLGHAARTLALARQVRRRVGGTHVVCVNTPFAGCLREPGITIHPLSAIDLPGQVQRLVADLRPTLFVADTFPRGVVGELVELLEGWSACPRALIDRGLPAAYVARFALTAFVRRHYDLVLVPGESGAFGDLPQARRCEPFLLRDRDELPPRRPEWVLVVGTGSVEECRVWAHLAEELGSTVPEVRLALPPGADVTADVPTIRHFPLIELLPRARLVIGAAGYNLVHECRHVGVPAVFQPLPRRYDDQRARSGGGVASTNGAASAAEWVIGELLGG